MVRTRMAPSPTGDYHIGHIRTALYNWAFSKKNNGKFLIRIEDTDRNRLSEGAAERILQVIRDYGLDWDEGPFYQSERLSVYKEHALKLVEQGHAYYCFCTPERLDELRKDQQSKDFATTRYDRHCLSMSTEDIEEKLRSNTPYVIRLKVPDNEEISFVDRVFGKITFSSSDVDDQVLLKSDGFPTYHLGVVVDDHLMGVTHVMRGNDWLPSTPKHILLYRAFGWDLPEYIHLPNLKEKGENRKLSKRYGAVFAIDFLREGYLPEAVLNFLMFLGWNPGTDKEIYSLEDFVNDFTIEKIHHTDLVAFDRDKLAWINGYYLRELSNAQLLERLDSWSEKHSVNLLCKGKDQDFNVKVINLVKDRLKVLSDFDKLALYFYRAPVVDKSLLAKFASADKASTILLGLKNVFERVEEWTIENIDRESHKFALESNLTPKESFMTLRVAVTGNTATPPIFDICMVLGRPEVLSRIDSALNTLNSV